MKYTILSLLAHLVLVLMILFGFSRFAKILPTNTNIADFMQIQAIYRPQPAQPQVSPTAASLLARPAQAPPPASIPRQSAGEESLALEHGADFASLASSAPAHIREKPELINADISIPYPLKARLRHIEGSVRLRLTVNQEGQVIDAQILSGPAHGLREAALKLAAKLCFLPATDEHGQPKIAYIEHEVVFRLTKGLS